MIPLDKQKAWLHSMWLGCSSASNQYKILKLSTLIRDRRYFSRFEILDVGSNSWRVITIGDTVTMSCLWCMFRNCNSHTFLDDVLYVLRGRTTAFFDFEREEFGVIKGPRNSDKNRKVKSCAIGVVDGCLVLAYCLSLMSSKRGRWSDIEFHSFVLWILRRNGNNKYWSKMFVTDDILCTCRYRTVQVVKNGAILLHSDTGDTLLYDPKDKSVKIEHAKSRVQVGNFVAVNPTFVSLKETLRLDEETLNFREEGIGSN